MILLQSIDQHWREHLAALDYLRQGIHLRGYAQKNPKQEYKREAFELFSQLLDVVKMDVTRILMTVRIQSRGRGARGRRGDRGARRAHQQRHLHASERRRQRLGRARQRIGGGAGGDGGGGGGDGVVTLGGRAGRRAEGGTQRSLSLREREEVQAVPRAGWPEPVTVRCPVGDYDCTASARANVAARIEVLTGFSLKTRP